MNINLQTGAYIPPPSLPVARSADIQVGIKQKNETPVLTTGQRQPDAAIAAEDKRYQQVLKAAKAVAADAYVVSDKSFSIFKDVSGQYITRYTSLRDGRVTYIPEPRLLQMFDSRYKDSSSAITIQA
jgi:hypothetical protein